MRQTGAVLRLVSSAGASGSPETASGAAPAGSRITVADTRITQDRAPVADDHASAGRNARQELLREWMGSHTRILGLWLDRLLEEGDDEDLISMIHRQYAWLSMMQARMERG